MSGIGPKLAVLSATAVCGGAIWFVYKQQVDQQRVRVVETFLQPGIEEESKSRPGAS